jgi:hypothetical protein
VEEKEKKGLAWFTALETQLAAADVKDQGPQHADQRDLGPRNPDGLIGKL